VRLSRRRDCHRRGDSCADDGAKFLASAYIHIYRAPIISADADLGFSCGLKRSIRHRAAVKSAAWYWVMRVSGFSSTFVCIRCSRPRSYTVRLMPFLKPEAWRNLVTFPSGTANIRMLHVQLFEGMRT